jgi:hypothetical protein
MILRWHVEGWFARGRRGPRMDGLTFFRSAARGLQVPTTLTPETTEHEGLQPRANERPRVGCCEELGSAADGVRIADNGEEKDIHGRY